MRIAGIVPESIVDGPGLRFVIFAQGCPHACPDCHNPQTWDPAGGKEATIKEIVKLIKKQIKHIRGITLSGGEPFLQAPEFAAIAQKAKEMGLDVATYSGYTYEELERLELPGVRELLEASDILVDGPFQAEKKDLGLPFRGSANQRVIDLKAARIAGKPVELVR